MKLPISFLLLLFCSKFGKAQILGGKVLDSNSTAPIPFVNVGVLHKNIGTVSDENGNYEIKLNKDCMLDTLKFSCIGYFSKSISVKIFLDQQKKDVKLKPLVHQLKEVTVSANKSKKIILGNTTKSKFVLVRFPLDELGSEIGTVLKNKKGRKIRLRNANFNLVYNAYDSLAFRVNIYNFSEQGIKDPILAQPIYVKTKLKKGILTIPLDEKDIYITQNAFLSLELVEHPKIKVNVDSVNYSLWFSAGFLNNKTYSRKTSQGDWKKLPVGAGFFVTADLIKE